jgi:hypothetical protein
MENFEKKFFNSKKKFKNSLSNILISGPRRSGKTSFLKSIVNHFCKIKKWNASNLISILNSNEELLVFIEYHFDILSIVSTIKFSELIILTIDGFVGLDLEIFETLILTNTSGIKRYIFLVTHLDLFKTWKSLKKAKKRIKDRLLKETNGNGKIFFFSGVKENSLYFSGEIKNLSRYLNKIKSNDNDFLKSQSYGIISKIEFKKSLKKNLGFFSAYFKNEIISTCNYKYCLIPGLGLVNILSIKKISKGLKSSNETLISGVGISEYYFFESQCMRSQKIKPRKNLFENKISVKFLSFISNFIALNCKKNTKLIKILLIDSRKIFEHSSTPGKVWNIESLISIFEKIHNQRRMNKVKIKTQNLIEKSNLSKNLNRNYMDPSNKFEKYVFKLSGISFSFRKYYDAYKVLILKLIKKKNNRIVVAKIIKNKWEKSILNSGKNYLISTCFNLILTKLYFFDHKNHQFNYVRKNLKSNGFSYICFYTDFDEEKDQIIGIKIKNQIRNIINQGTTFSFFFTGQIIFFKNNFKMFKKIKIKGTIFKTFKKTAFIRGMFNSDMDAIRFKNAIIKTANGIRGILKNINSKNSHGNIRATFEKKIPKGTSVSIVSYVNVEAYKNYEEIFNFLIATDLLELFY